MDKDSIIYRRSTRGYSSLRRFVCKNSGETCRPFHYTVDASYVSLSEDERLNYANALGLKFRTLVTNVCDLESNGALPVEENALFN